MIRPWVYFALVVAAGACRFTQTVGAIERDAGARDAADVNVDADKLTWRYGSLTVGGQRTCVVVAGFVRCWGDHQSGSLGRELAAPSSIPLTVTGVEGVTELAMGTRHTCALTDGNVWCWGENNLGQLASEVTYSAAPRRVEALVGEVRAIVSRYQTTCARRGDGAWWCWGALLPNLDGAATGSPPRELSMLAGAERVGLGAAHLCGLWSLDGAARVRCAGHNGAGQLGDETTVNRAEMRDVVGDDGRAITQVADLALGEFSTCVLLGDRRSVRCWGSVTQDLSVTLRADEPLRALGVGEAYVCALTESGRALCWGQNADGQLGDGTREASLDDSFQPVHLPESVRLSALAVASRHACAREATGRALWCWGLNRVGQLGAGDLDAHLTPVEVISR
jgi:alpha-tubulin suppressor-like RCC1 family protein